MATLRIMDRQAGDRTLEWDATDERSVELAQHEFDQLIKGQGRFRAYHVIEKGGKREGEPISEFPPVRDKAPEGYSGPVLEDVEEVLLVPPLAGGS